MLPIPMLATTAAASIMVTVAYGNKNGETAA